MIQKVKLTYDQIMSKFQVNKPWDTIIIFVLNILLTIPVFLIVHQNTIDVNWFWHIDRVLIFILIVVIIQLLLRAMRKIILISIFLYLVALFVGTVFGGYGFKSVFERTILNPTILL